jgi:hypothetical protein
MTRARAILFLILFTLALPLFFISLSRLAAAPAPQARVWGDPHIAIVADTTAGMQPELDDLARAWSRAFTGQQASAASDPASTPSVNEPLCHEIPCGPLTATFHLLTFKDVPEYLGRTQDPVQFGNQLSNLDAGGGDGCPDGALRALLLAARNLPEQKTPSADALLVTDATPMGRRPNYAFVVDKLLERGIRAHTLVSGWCAGAPLSPAVMGYLSLATGGQFHMPESAGEYMTDTIIALTRIDADDLLLSRAGTVSPGAPEIIPLALDGTATTLGVDDIEFKCPPYCCLTCVVPIPGVKPNIVAPASVQIELLDPTGNVVGPGTPGYSVLTSSSRELQELQPPSQSLPSGTWRLRISGDGPYQVDVIANSSLHMAYLGHHFLPAGQTSPIRALLTCEGCSPPTTAQFRLFSLDGQQSAPIMLYDDGAHGDGNAGDGIYGGAITPPRPGQWRLGVRGELGDGTPFQRIDPAPIRVQPFRLANPSGGAAPPGAQRSQTFSLTNTSLTGPATVFDLALYSSQGWTMTDTVPLSVTLSPGQTFSITVDVVVPADAPLGVVEESTFVAVPVGDIGGGASAVARTTAGGGSQTYLPAISRP